MLLIIIFSTKIKKCQLLKVNRATQDGIPLNKMLLLIAEYYDIM